MIFRRQKVTSFGRADDSAYLGANELRQKLVCREVSSGLDKSADQTRAARPPSVLKDTFAFFAVELENRSGRHLRRDSAGGFALPSADFGIVVLVVVLALRIHRPVLRGQTEVRCPLKDVEVPGRGGHDGDRLDGSRTGSDERDPLSREVDILLWPSRGMVKAAAEAIDAWNIR
jgi:hypothetical protein